VWPSGESFESAVRAGILDAVVANGSPTVGGIFKLDAIVVDPIHSSENAFRIAAREAARSVLSMLKAI
jgi:hypothetical protein